MIVALDHVYDLQHNTGSIFTKNIEYAKKGKKVELLGLLGQKYTVRTDKPDFSWIKKALDFKRDLTSVRELLNKVSPSMRTLASRIIKNKNIR